MSWIRNAFAVDPPGPAEPNETQSAIIDKVLREVVRRGATTPALMALQMTRPLNFIGSQAMVFFQPALSVLVDTNGYREFADFLEHRGSMEYFCQRLEALEDEVATEATTAETATTDEDETRGP